MRLISDEVRTARKPHRCIWCGQPISAGEQYRYQRLIFDGEPNSNHWHPECFDAVDWSSGDYEDGFTPYEGERPSRTAVNEGASDGGSRNG